MHLFSLENGRQAIQIPLAVALLWHPTIFFESPDSRDEEAAKGSICDGLLEFCIVIQGIVGKLFIALSQACRPLVNMPLALL